MRRITVIRLAPRVLCCARLLKHQRCLDVLGCSSLKEVKIILTKFFKYWQRLRANGCNCAHQMCTTLTVKMLARFVLLYTVHEHQMHWWCRNRIHKVAPWWMRCAGYEMENRAWVRQPCEAHFLTGWETSSTHRGQCLLESKVRQQTCYRK